MFTDLRHFWLLITNADVAFKSCGSYCNQGFNKAVSFKQNIRVSREKASGTRFSPVGLINALLRSDDSREVISAF